MLAYDHLAARLPALQVCYARVCSRMLAYAHLTARLPALQVPAHMYTNIFFGKKITPFFWRAWPHVCSRNAKKKRKAAWALACLARGKNKVSILAGAYPHVSSRMLAGDPHSLLRMLHNFTALLQLDTSSINQSINQSVNELINE
jgi:hypothetical protein